MDFFYQITGIQHWKKHFFRGVFFLNSSIILKFLVSLYEYFSKLSFLPKRVYFDTTKNSIHGDFNYKVYFNFFGERNVYPLHKVRSEKKILIDSQEWNVGKAKTFNYDTAELDRFTRTAYKNLYTHRNLNTKVDFKKNFNYTFDNNTYVLYKTPSTKNKNFIADKDLYTSINYKNVNFPNKPSGVPTTFSNVLDIIIDLLNFFI